MSNNQETVGSVYDYKDLVKKLKLLPFEKRLEVVNHMAKNMSYDEITAMGLSKENTHIFHSSKRYFDGIQIQALEQELKLIQEMEKQGLDPTDMKDRQKYQKNIIQANSKKSILNIQNLKSIH